MRERNVDEELVYFLPLYPARDVLSNDFPNGTDATTMSLMRDQLSQVVPCL